MSNTPVLSFEFFPPDDDSMGLRPRIVDDTRVV